MSFSKDVNKFTDKYDKRLKATARTAVQDLEAEISATEGEGGRLPIDTGFLRASFGWQIGSMPSGPVKPEKSENLTDETLTGLPVNVALARWDFSKPLFGGFSAAYARRLEFGFEGQDKLGRFISQPGRGFVRGGTEKWDRIVDSAARRVKARI